MQCLAAYGQKPVKDQFTKCCRLTPRDLRERVKIIFKLLLLTRRYVLRKNQRALSKREKLQKSLKYDSGCTVWQGTPPNQVNINLPNFVR